MTGGMAIVPVGRQHRPLQGTYALLSPVAPLLYFRPVFLALLIGFHTTFLAQPPEAVSCARSGLSSVTIHVANV